RCAHTCPVLTDGSSRTWRASQTSANTSRVGREIALCALRTTPRWLCYVLYGTNTSRWSHGTSLSSPERRKRQPVRPLIRQLQTKHLHHRRPNRLQSVLIERP